MFLRLNDSETLEKKIEKGKEIRKTNVLTLLTPLTLEIKLKKKKAFKRSHGCQQPKV